jgi:tartrate-resistant acid phosphatase type 5
MIAAACAPRQTTPIPSTRLALPTTTSNSLRLIIVGDLHTHGPEKVARGIARVNAETPANAILLVGDNFDPCGITSVDDPQWQNVVRHLSPIGLPMFPILGNHDYGNPKARMAMTVLCGKPDVDAQIAASARVSNWRFPARNYVLTSAVADIVMVDTTPLAMNRERPLLGSATAGEIRDFAARELAAAGGRWRIVAGHHNMRYSGKQRWKSAATRRHMAAFEDLLVANGTDIYLCGHQHQLELIVPRERAPAMLISGAAWRPKKDDALTAEIDDDSHFLSNRVGFATLDLDATSFRVTFYDAAGTAMERSVRFDRETHARIR